MRYNYEVRWHEWNLTKQKSRKFFTEMGASFFAWYKEFFFGAVTKIYEI